MSTRSENNIPQPGSQNKLLRALAMLVSYVFHPVFFPLVMALVIYRLSPADFMMVTQKQAGLWMISIAVTAVFFPLFSIALMKPLGFIQSYHLPTARERTIPLMVTMIFYFWITHVFNNIQGPPLVLRVLLLANFWGIILLFMANIFVKVSMHTATAGGMVGILIVLMKTSPADMTLPLLAAILLAGIIGTARMILGAHERGDIWLGYIIGLSVQMGAYVYLK